jgi:ectoine hydroxylase-related dioxygenase (phytanoyl-CoA dioxygenase family)
VAAKRDVAAFDEQGFTVLRGVIDPAELAALREETQAQIEAGPDREPASDFVTGLGADGTERFFRIQFLTDKAVRNDSLLLALAHPAILERVRLIAGDDATTYGSAMVFKSTDGGPEVSLHRDIGTQGSFSPAHRFFNVDIYLDAATPDTGCLRVLPGSHRPGGPTADSLEHGGLIDVVMEPGDVLFHDSMLLHGSFATPPGSPLRRVLYYSYQSAGWMLREGVLPGLVPPRRWVAENMKLVAHAATERTHAPHLPLEEAPGLAVPAEWCDEVNAADLHLRPVAGNLPWERAR